MVTLAQWPIRDIALQEHSLFSTVSLPLCDEYRAAGCHSSGAQRYRQTRKPLITT